MPTTPLSVQELREKISGAVVYCHENNFFSSSGDCLGCAEKHAYNCGLWDATKIVLDSLLPDTIEHVDMSYSELMKLIKELAL